MGDDESVGLYVVFEFIKAPTLRERLSAGPLPPGEVAQVAKAVGAALAHGHASGVVHRDVRPESILLAPGGVKLTEPGFASIARADPTLRQAMPALKEGFLPMYAAPESLASDQYGPHTDQFALAATLYEALTGKRAFGDGEATAVAARVMAGGRRPRPRPRCPACGAFPTWTRSFAEPSRAIPGSDSRHAMCWATSLRRRSTASIRAGSRQGRSRRSSLARPAGGRTQRRERPCSSS